ncbi:MAG: Nudix family hydrolase, partial [Methylococcales bacterium]
MPSGRNAPIHVVAGVLRDTRGRILLTRRTEGRDLAGAWEFPGGKVEPGESAAIALHRELFEELGIEVGAIEPLISVPQRYPDKSIVLDVYTVLSYSGKPKGREKQALAWSPMEKLISYPMPPADKPVVAALIQPPVLAITPEFYGDKQHYLSCIKQQLSSGIRFIQLRCKSLTPKKLNELAVDIRTLCQEENGTLFINEDIGLAKALDCPVHLKSTQLLLPDTALQLAGHPFSAACHNIDDLEKAEALGATHAVLGPVLKTNSHPGIDGIGWAEFARMRNEVSLPIFALGGLGLH